MNPGWLGVIMSPHRPPHETTQGVTIGDMLTQLGDVHQHTCGQMKQQETAKMRKVQQPLGTFNIWKR